MNNLDDYRGRLLARAFYDELEKLSADAQGLSTGDKGAWAGSSHLSKPQGIQINPVTPTPKPQSFLPGPRPD